MSLEKEQLQVIISLTDLTSLGGSDHNDTISKLCDLAKQLEQEHGLGLPAAVCVWPVFVGQCREELKGLDIKIACVAGAFPSGLTPLHLRLKEVQYCIDEGADEVDMVISRGRMLQGEHVYIYDEIAAMKELCGEVHLKAILETGELMDEDIIRKASQIALEAGADFIKTSTGKIKPAATIEASRWMLEEVKRFNDENASQRGFKAAGGISTVESALEYLDLAKQINGEDFISAATFRIGASSLVKDVLKRA